ncbi:MAG: PA2779 family protein [Syntrophales bacterium]
MRKPVIKFVSICLVVPIFCLGMVPRIEAGMAPSAMIVPQQSERSEDIGKIQKFLEMKMISEKLKSLGFTPDEIQARLSGLNDQQIHQLALQVDDLKVAGDFTAALWIGAIIIILVAVVLYFSGAMK